MPYTDNMKKSLSLLLCLSILLTSIFGNIVPAYSKIISSGDIKIDYTINNADGEVDYFLCLDDMQEFEINLKDNEGNPLIGFDLSITSSISGHYYDMTDMGSGRFLIDSIDVLDDLTNLMSDVMRYNLQVVVRKENLVKTINIPMKTIYKENSGITLNSPESGWYIRIDQGRQHVTFNNNQYNAYKLVGPKVDGVAIDSYLIYDDNGNIPDLKTYSDAVKILKVSTLFKSAYYNDKGDSFLDAISLYNKALKAKDVTEFIGKVRNVGAAVVGGIIGAWATGGLNISSAVIAVVAEATGAAAYGIIAELVLMDAEEISPKTVKAGLKNDADKCLRESLIYLQKAADEINSRSPYETWTPNEAQIFYDNLTKGIVDSHYYSEIIAITMTETDPRSQLQDITSTMLASMIPFHIGDIAKMSYDTVMQFHEVVEAIPGYNETVDMKAKKEVDFKYHYERNWTKLDDVLVNADLIINGEPIIDASLKDLKINGVTIEGFSSNKLDYTYTEQMAYLSSIPKVEAIPTDKTAEIIINNPPWIIFPEDTVIQITVKSGTKKEVYRITIKPIISSESRLDFATIEGRGGEMLDGFSAGQKNYTVNLTINDSFPKLYGYAKDVNSDVEIIQPRQVPGIGKIIVTAPDGVSKETYTFDFRFSGSDNNRIGDILVDGKQIPGFWQSEIQYYYKLPRGASLPSVEVIAEHKDAIVQIRQAIKIDGGKTTINVIAENGSVAWCWINWGYIPDGEEVLEFPDPVFQAVVRDECHISNGKQIFKSDLAGETSISVHNQGDLITSLEGIEHFIDLEELDVEGHNISNIKGLGQCTKLHTLEMNGNKLSDDDVSEFETLTNLRDIELDMNNLSNITAFSNLINLEVLNIRNNKIQSIESLRDTTKLTELLISGNYIDDFMPVYDYYKQITKRDFVLSLSKDADLDYIMINNTELAEFDSKNLIYYVTLNEGAPVPRLTCEQSDTKATVTIQNPTEIPGEAVITVTAEDGVTTKVYKVLYSYNVPSYDTRLKNITVNGESIEGFDPSVYNYSVTLPVGTELQDVSVESIEKCANAKVMMPDILPGDVKIVVLQYGAMTSTYTVKIDKEVEFNPSTDLAKYGNLSGNVVNDGEYVKSGDWIYFRGDKNQKLYKMSLDGSQIVKIADVEVDQLAVVDDWIYYEDSNDIYRIKTDGTGHKMIGEFYKVPSFHVKGDMIYMIMRPDNASRDMIYKMNVNGDMSTLTQICANEPDDLNIADSGLYFINEADDDHIYFVNFDGTGLQRVGNNKAYRLVVKDEMLYFIYNDIIYMMSNKGTGLTSILGADLNDLNVSDDYIFYTVFDNDDEMYRANLNGSNKIKLNSVESDYPQIVGDWLIYYNDDDGHYCKMRFDGSLDSPVYIPSTDAGLNAILLNNTPISSFDKGVYTYTVNQSGLDLPEIKVIKSDVNSSIESIVYSGKIDDNTLKADIKVVADDGATESHYIVNFNLDLSQEVIQFADEALETYIRSVTEKYTGPIHRSDVQDFETLDISSLKLTSLEGIQYFTSLRVLKCNSNELRSVTPLGDLTKLEKLSLQGNQITDISFVTNLVKLYELNISENNIRDISYVNQLPVIRNLDISSNNISDISFLCSVMTLEQLYVANNPLQNINGIEGLTSLIILDLNNTNRVNINFVQNLVNLRTLYLDDNQISDVTSVGDLDTIRNLYLNNNTITDISPLANCTNLTYLFLDVNQISNIESLRPLSKLKFLYLNGNPISDYTPVKSFYNNLIGKDFAVYPSGDCNGDGVVDILDIVIFNKAYGSHETDSCWDERGDFNGDSVIDEADLAILLGAIGR